MKEIRVQWPDCTNGFMDFVRGVMCIDQLFGHEYRVTPVIDPKRSIIKALDWSNSELYVPQQDAVSHYHYYNDVYDFLAPKLNEEVTYLTNHYFMPNLLDCRRYKWLLTPRKEFNDLSEARALATISGKYLAIHIRIHEHTEVDESIAERYGKALAKVCAKNNDLPIVLICSDTKLRKYCRDRFSAFIQPSTWPRFSAVRMSNEEIIGLFTDIKIIGGAKRIISLCDFPWGSTGFSMITAAVYGKPYRNYRPDRV